MIVFILLVLSGVMFIATPFLIIFAKKIKKNVKIKQAVNNNLPAPGMTTGIAEPVAIDRDREKLNKFLENYDPNKNFKFENVNYRKGAGITCAFNLAEGYTYINGKMTWGYVRIHTGVDRAGGGVVNNIKDIVLSPFDFERSAFTDYRGTGYGTLVQLFNDEYEFEMRIGHMHPTLNILAWTLNHLKRHDPIKQNWIIGSAGTYGDSSGNHTHTEFLSQDEECEILELLLRQQYGDDILKEYTDDEIYNFYQTQSYFKGKSRQECLENWQKLKKDRQVYFSNKYMYKAKGYDGKFHTWYASNYLFGGL